LQYFSEINYAMEQKKQQVFVRARHVASHNFGARELFWGGAKNNFRVVSYTLLDYTNFVSPWLSNASIQTAQKEQHTTLNIKHIHYG